MKRALVSAAFAFVATATLAQNATPPANYQALLTPLLQSGVDVLGNPIVYPEGTPNVTAAIVTLAPGASTGWHTHEVPLYAFIIEGELTVDYGEKGTKVYTVGDSVLEAMNWPHNGTNTGTVDMKLIAVYMGAVDTPNTVKVTAP